MNFDDSFVQKVEYSDGKSQHYHFNINLKNQNRKALFFKDLIQNGHLSQIFVKTEKKNRVDSAPLTFILLKFGILS